jgi:F0F1-type ATP synthase membrane subunit c/vacuolar-type H+-ATPase subunit K
VLGLPRGEKVKLALGTAWRRKAKEAADAKVGFQILGAGLCCGLSSLACGLAIGVAGDACVRGYAQTDGIFVGMLLILS